MENIVAAAEKKSLNTVINLSLESGLNKRKRKIHSIVRSFFSISVCVSLHNYLNNCSMIKTYILHFIAQVFFFILHQFESKVMPRRSFNRMLINSIIILLSSSISQKAKAMETRALKTLDTISISHFTICLTSSLVACATLRTGLFE